MLQRLMTAGALAGALLLLPVADRPANALVGAPTALKSTGDTQNIATQVRRGFSGFRGSSFRGFRGSSFRGFRGGPRISGFRAGPRFYGHRGFRGIRSGVRFGHRGWRHKGWRGHRWRSRGWRYGLYAAPFIGYGAYNYGYYGDGCQWLKRRAIYTGSGYWWRRYEACRYGY